MLSNGFMTLRFGENAGPGDVARSRICQTFCRWQAFCRWQSDSNFVWRALPVSTLWGVLKQRSAPNKQKLKGGADLVPLFSLMASRPL